MVLESNGGFCASAESGGFCAKAAYGSSAAHRESVANFFMTILQHVRVRDRSGHCITDGALRSFFDAKPRSSATIAPAKRGPAAPRTFRELFRTVAGNPDRVQARVLGGEHQRAFRAALLLCRVFLARNLPA